MSKLKTIEEHNDEIFKTYENFSKPSPSGIACPNCGAELLIDRTLTYTSYPPQQSVNCPECDYQGTVFC